MILLKKLIECGASAPYHRMRKQLQRKEKQTYNNNANNSIGLAGSSSTAVENKKQDTDDINRIDDNGEIVLDNESNDAENRRRKDVRNGSILVNNDDNDNSTISYSMYHGGNDKDDERDADGDIEYYLETATDLLKNTPLQWATVKGHLRSVWLLLLDGYSPNDMDVLGNNSLHLAAVNGHFQILKVLIEDGGHANIVNIYKNLPIDMATGQL